MVSGKRRSVGKALENALKPEKGSQSSIQDQGKHLSLLNAKRREILEFLCMHPCSLLSAVSSGTGVSFHTAKWHIEKMLEAGLVEANRISKKKVFYPTGFIATDDVELFTFFSQSSVRCLTRMVFEEPGMSQSELSETIVFTRRKVSIISSKLEEFEVISIVQDGVHVRYYPTEIFDTKRNDYRQRMQEFKKWIIKWIKKEKLGHTIVRNTSNELIIKMEAGLDVSVLRIATDPFSTAITDQLIPVNASD